MTKKRKDKIMRKLYIVGILALLFLTIIISGCKEVDQAVVDCPCDEEEGTLWVNDKGGGPYVLCDTVSICANGQLYTYVWLTEEQAYRCMLDVGTAYGIMDPSQCGSNNP